tara:strand:+ start:810 stop:1649 length:840 start_codon:yes stop_codon:yes gene_type:complete
MTRNSRKFQKKDSKIQQKPEQNDNPFGLSFVVSTEFVSIPTKGKFYPKTSSLHGVEQVEIKHMTAKEEDIISSITAETGERVFEKLLDNLIIDKNIKAADLCEEDKTALLLSARATGYGSDYIVNDYCDKCNSTTKFTYDLTKTQIIESDKKFDYDSELDTYTVLLPISNISAMIKQPSDEDLDSINRERAQKEKHGIQFNETVTFLKKVIVSANNVSDPKLINDLMEVLPAADAKIIKTFFANCKPRISTIQDVFCSNCGSPSRKEAPLSWAFFWYNT